MKSIHPIPKKPESHTTGQQSRRDQALAPLARYPAYRQTVANMWDLAEEGTIPWNHLRNFLAGSHSIVLQLDNAYVTEAVRMVSESVAMVMRGELA